MPDADSRFNPPSASNSSASDEATQLELHLQRQLEEDVARIFDESLYSDLEVVCGKLKILTHSCILKARTKKFYHKLQTFLHLNIARSTFDEIYSFISDTYTECDIKHQEKEILEYLKSVPIYSLKSKTEHREELEEFLTPKCISPYVEKTLKKSISSSPSTELTKEYYALVPIEGNFLEKELIEQDVLSTAFQTIISSQSGDLEKTKIIPCTKPTSLALASSHSSKTVKHSSSCDILKKSHHKDEKSSEIYKKIVKETITIPSQNIKANLELRRTSATGVESVYSPDSLVIDDPSSSSDYLSAYTFSPGLGSACQTQLNVGDTTKMENIFTSSDSGLENTGMLESLTSHKDITMTDMSLTESTLHDLTADDGSNSHDSTSSPIVEKRNNFHNNTEDILSTEVNSSSDQLNKQKEQSSSSKEEKQRQNEEIVILESSSLSSETGSWESVFPPKLPIKDACVKFIQTERQHFHGIYNTEKQSPVQKSAFKSTSCFIDAASLVDEDATSSSAKLLMAIERLSFKQDELPTANPEALLPAPSQPVPCSTNKNDFSPNDWSENENEDSLEQLDNKDPDSIQKDLSPTIFEMTPITEDSLCANVFESGSQAEKPDSIKPIAEESLNLVKDGSISASTVLMSNTPHNSIMSIKANVLKQYESEESESDTTLVGRDNQGALKGVKKYNESSPIISGGASVEDHLPTIGSFTNSPLSRRRIENTQIVSGAYVPPLETGKQLKSPRLISSSAWTVDMSVESTEGEPKSYNRTGAIPKKLSAKTEKLRNSKSSKCHQNCSKSRSSVDSDSSDRSSHKFYIDFSSLPDDPIPSQNHYESEGTNEKNNMFSMYIDIGKNPVKEMPPKLISKKSSSSGAKNNSKSNQNKSTNDFAAVFTKIEAGEPCSTSIFEKYESLCDDPNISISEIISLNGRPGQNSANRNNKDLSVNELNKKSSSHNYQDAIQEEGKLFVKLSDLDKPVQKIDLPTAKNDNYHVLVERMTRSIPENNWSDQNQASTSRSNEVISSFHSENALSLNRLFPHLRNEFSRSMPGSLASRTRSPLRLGASSSPGDIEDQTSEASDMSSVQSSLCRSIVENSTTEETSQASSLIGNSQSRLGQDLLRMFLEEIAPDVIVEVSGRRIKAHKCILSSRCQYFAGILSGGWVESAGNVIALPPFSFNVVHFALCHIYSGVSTIPDTISIVELATLADMLGLEGLKEAIMFTLKAKYCHHFHRPCSVCTVGVLECFPLCSVYGLDDLYRKCLKWISKYFTRVWPTKSFATLPSELLEKCYQQVVVNITLETILETIMGCGLTVGSLHNSRWAEVVARMCRRLIHAAAHFVAPKLVTLLREISALPADPSRSALQALNECVVAAIEWAPPEECCRAYAFLAGVAREIRNCRFVKPDLITNGNNVLQRQDNLLYVHSNGWLLKCEGALVRAAPRVCCTQAFIELPHDLRRRLRELGCIMYGGQAQLPAPPERPPAQIRRSRSTHQSANGSAVSTSRNSEIDQMRASFVPYAPRPPTHVSAEIARPAIAEARSVPPIVRTTRAQEERAKFNLSKTNLSQERLNTRTSMRAPYENTRPRYLEPRQIQDNRKTSSNRTLQPRIMSSSESSRNSSPIQVRNLRTSRMKTRQIIDPNALALQAYSHDSLATSSRPRTAEPSTDSLSESQNSNRYATYTRSRHTTRGSVPAGPMHANKNPKPPTQTNSHLAPNSGRVRTKIPVYLNQVTRSNVDNKSHVESQKRQTHIGKTPTTTYNNTTSVPLRKINEKNSLCSLMSATKSSSAKMVTKVVKDSPRNKPAPKNTKNASKRQLRRAEVEPSEIPIMERSGTFLKDEPTFGDKTTNIDLDQ